MCCEHGGCVYLCYLHTVCRAIGLCGLCFLILLIGAAISMETSTSVALSGVAKPPVSLTSGP